MKSTGNARIQKGFRYEGYGYGSKAKGAYRVYDVITDTLLGHVRSECRTKTVPVRREHATGIRRTKCWWHGATPDGRHHCPHYQSRNDAARCLRQKLGASS